MGFYHGTNNPPPDDDQGSLKDALQISWVVMKTLALPLAIMLGVVAYFMFVFYMFTMHPLAGLGAILAVVAVVAVRGAWELRHPPTLKE